LICKPVRRRRRRRRREDDVDRKHSSMQEGWKNVVDFASEQQTTERRKCDQLRRFARAK
jgi:hypothetical protein